MAVAEIAWGLQRRNACSSARFFTRGFRLRGVVRWNTVGTGPTL